MKLQWYDTKSFAGQSDAAQEFVDDVLKASDYSYLETKIRATHSGQLITGRCYTGKGMRNGVGTWFDMKNGGTSAFDKPVIVNHDMHSEPLGRVVFAEFVKVKEGFEFLNDWRTPDSGPGKMGSGYIVTTSHIADPEAIRKIIDGRYNTVSTRQQAEEAWCSVCGTSFHEGCDHEIGSYYEVGDNEHLCYAVTGDLEYIEQSFVNSPRQPNAVTQSFKMMRKAMQDSGEDGVILLADCRYEDADELRTWMRSSKDHKVVINLSDAELPSIGVITGRTMVSMPKINGAPESTKLAGVYENTTELESADENTQKEEVTSTDNEPEVKPEETETFDFAFANLARFWKDDLDLESDFTDMGSFAIGITDKADGHAHVFDGWVQDKKFKGSTYITGQGKAKEPHTHAIWMDSIDMNMDAVRGETRDASAGPSHMHGFSATMSDESNTYVTLMTSADSIKHAIQLLDERVNKDTLESADTEKLLNEENTSVVWDEEMIKKAMPLIARLSQSKRREVLADIFKDKLAVNEDEEMPDLNQKLLDSLLDDKEKLKVKNAELVQALDSKEAERQQLLDENVSLKATALALKARLVVEARAKLTETVLDDEEKSEEIEKLASLDEEELDKLLDAEVLGNVRREVEEVKTKKTDINDETPLNVVDDVANVSTKNKKDAKDEEPKRSTKGLAYLQQDA